MDEQYHAKLTASPPGKHRATTPVPPGGAAPNAIPSILDPLPSPYPPHTNVYQVQDAQGPIPIHLPDIYVNPFPSQQAAQPLPPPVGETPTARSIRMIKIGPWIFCRPHPLLWLCFGLSLLALVLEVPKGSLPTITGRHKALRTREKQLQDRLNLLSQFSAFLPPPLSNLISPSAHTSNSNSPLIIDEQLRHAPGMRFWTTHANPARYGGDQGGGEGDGRWWLVEDLGEGASVVRSRNDGEEKEVWVLRMDGQENNDKALLHALTHSLLLRDRLLAENTKLKTTPCPVCPPASNRITSSHFHETDTIPEDHKVSDREEWERLEVQRKREKEREKEVEEREREVARREKWVVDEMRQLSDKVHSQATELMLEDRITERLKAYQRQLVQVAEKDEL